MVVQMGNQVDMDILLSNIKPKPPPHLQIQDAAWQNHKPNTPSYTCLQIALYKVHSDLWTEYGYPHASWRIRSGLNLITYSK